LLILENASSFRREVRFIIPRHPTHALKTLDIKTRFPVETLSIKNGISFCQVLKIVKALQDIPSLTSGYQKKNGNKPSFVRRAK